MANANPAPNVSAAFIIDIDKIQSSERSRALIAKIDFIPLETNDNSIVWIFRRDSASDFGQTVPLQKIIQ